MAEFPFVILIAAAVLSGLWISNILYDFKVPHYTSRKIGHAAGGLAYLLCAFLFSSGWWPLILSVSFVVLLWGARALKPTTFRGVGGSGRPTKAMAEVWFPLAAIPVIGAGWIWLDRPIITAACLLFMCWGDCLTGLVRSQIYGKAVKGLWGSAAMFLACLLIAWAFIEPFWVGVVGAAVATATEWTCGDVGIIKKLDDNLMIPLTSAATVLGILALIA